MYVTRYWYIKLLWAVMLNTLNRGVFEDSYVIILSVFHQYIHLTLVTIASAWWASSEEAQQHIHSRCQKNHQKIIVNYPLSQTLLKSDALPFETCFTFWKLHISIILCAFMRVCFINMYPASKARNDLSASIDLTYISGLVVQSGIGFNKVIS